MPIDSLSTLSNTIGSLLPTGYTGALENTDDTDLLGGFSNIFHDAIKNTEVTDTVDKASQLDLLTGLADDFSGVLIDSEKASIALSLTVQLRNKVLDAYNEIMRMQV